MEKSKNIIREYEKCDEMDRLYLFLEHPLLREVFMEIEMKKPTPETGRCRFSHARSMMPACVSVCVVCGILVLLVCGILF